MPALDRLQTRLHEQLGERYEDCITLLVASLAQGQADAKPRKGESIEQRLTRLHTRRQQITEAINFIEGHK